MLRSGGELEGPQRRLAGGEGQTPGQRRRDPLHPSLPGQRLEYEATGGEVLCDLSAFVGANEKGHLEASVFGFGSNNNRLFRITVRGKVRFWACEPMVGCLPDGGLLLAQTCGPEYKRRLPPPQGIRYEVSYDAGLTRTCFIPWNQDRSSTMELPSLPFWTRKRCWWFNTAPAARCGRRSRSVRSRETSGEVTEKTASVLRF